MKLSIGVKISIVFALIMVFFAGLAFYITSKVEHTKKLFVESSQISGDSQCALIYMKNAMLELDVASIKLAQDPSDSLFRYRFVNAYSQADSSVLRLQQLSTALPDSLKQEIAALFSPIQNQLESYQQFQQDQIKAVALKDAVAKAEMLGYVSRYSILHVNSLKIEDQITKLESKFGAIHESQNKKIEKILVETEQRLTIGGFLLLVLIVCLAVASTYFLMKPIRFMNQQLSLMGKGVLPNQPLNEGKDELGHMAANLNMLVEGLQKVSLFANEMGKGNFDSKFEPLSEKDTLGNALIRMREELKAASEEEAKRKEEDQQRNWASQGIARFSEILRENNNNIEDLSFNVISNLVKYVGANQGGMFVLNDSNVNELSVELTACYAYDRKKFVSKSYAMGEGLIGRCAQEQESIFLTDIPKGYAEISSGLGNDDPRCLFIVPLKANEKVLGAMELAAFDVLQPYQIEFIEKIAESIASTIATVKINIQTKQLLEQSRRQAEDMASQEQEMRQNMEQLRATQELSARKEAELLKQIKDLKG
jgi:GAF domain-containing protein